MRSGAASRRAASVFFARRFPDSSADNHRRRCQFSNIARGPFLDGGLREESANASLRGGCGVGGRDVLASDALEKIASLRRHGRGRDTGSRLRRASTSGTSARSAAAAWRPSRASAGGARVLQGHHRRRRLQDQRRRARTGAVTDTFFGGTIGAIAVASRIPTSCTWAPARRRSAATCRTATASTSRPTAARRGRTSGSADARSRASASTRRIRMSSTSRRTGTCGGRIRDRGVFRTKDGGKTWKKVLFGND